MADDDDPEQAMRETRQRFIAAFQHQCDSIALLVNTVASLGPRGPVAALKQVVHRMSGMAGTIGFPTVSQRASELEHLVAKSGQDPAVARALVGALRESFTHDLASPPVWASASRAAESLKVLVVEDDPDLRKLVVSFLRDAGHRPVAIPAGDLAVAAAVGEQPAVIVLDVELPGLDGYSVCRLLKADPDLAEIPVIFMTARSGVDERLAGLLLGADAYLGKPVDMRELLFRIRLLRGRRQTAQTSAPAALPPTGELTYDAFVLVAREQLAQTTAALALVRVPLEHARRVVAAIRDEIRRRDTMGRYDRGHVLVLLPQVSIGAARDRLADLVQRLRAEGINGVHAGVAGSPAPNAASLESLVAEADEALAEARNRGEAAAVKSDRPRRIVTASHLTVLIADDDPEITRVVDAQMRAAGYHTIAAFDGEQAMQAVASRAPDVVVLDLTMPKLSGFDVLGRLHQLTGARPSIVVLSARGQEDDVRRAFELGADDYITKPFDAQELLARVTRVLR